MTLLKAVERSLFACAAILAAWCSITLIRAEYVRRMPIPDPPARTSAEASGIAESNDRALRLPGDPGTGSDLDEPRVDSGAWLARLEAPSLGLTATVLEGSGDDVLDRAAGHIEQTALPGNDGNVGIAGHRDTIFRPLQHARAGQLLRLTTRERVLLYAISSTAIVEPTEVAVLAPTDEPALTLVTCYPFRYVGPAPKRFIVRAHLVDSHVR